MCPGPRLIPFCHSITNVLRDSIIGLDEVESSENCGDSGARYEDHQYANEHQEAAQHDIY